MHERHKYAHNNNGVCMSNIVQFPNLKAPTKDNLEKSVRDYKLEAIDYAADELYGDLFSRINYFGFDITDEHDLKDVALVVESIKSLLCKVSGVDHPLQKLATKMMSIQEVDDDNDGTD